MVAPTFAIAGRGAKDVASEHLSYSADTPQLRYRLDVVASDSVDVVRSAGGWLFDRVMAGWEVSVFVPKALDSRPLQILGVRTFDLESQWFSTTTGEAGASLAVSADAWTADQRIRERVLTALSHSLTEVVLWGDTWPLAVDSAVVAVHHVLSAAAQAFKGQALMAAGVSDTVSPIETMRSARKTCLPVASDLIPVD